MNESKRKRLGELSFLWADLNGKYVVVDFGDRRLGFGSLLGDESLLIEDEELHAAVVARMLEAGIEVVPIDQIDACVRRRGLSYPDNS